MKQCSTKLLILTIVGLICLITGIVFCSFWPHNYGVFDGIIYGKLSLRTNSWGSRFWNGTRNNPRNVEFYLFNWTNPKDLTVTGTKPNFVEVGPYSFIEKIQKINIIFHPENGTVSFDELKSWHFDQEKSVGSLSDKITQLNVVAVSIAHKKRYSHFNLNTLSMLLKATAMKIFTTKTVDELLFTGYKDPLIKLVNTAFKKDVPLPDHFGWYYMQNATTLSGHINMGTGENGLSNYGIIKNWNYKNTTSYYDTPCNHVEGSAGEFWPPSYNTEDITKWMSDLCRPVTYEYTGKTTHQGISGYQYSIGEKTLGNNQCYCNGDCSPTGLINITACRSGDPVFISLPHFYKGDSILREQILGMNPNEINHNSYITLDPNTGIPLQAASRLQINVLLQPSTTVQLFKDVPKIYFPILWVNLKSEITESSAESLSDLLKLPSTVLYGCIVLLIIGALTLLIIVIILYLKNQSKILWISMRRTSGDDNERRGRCNKERIMMSQECYYNERLI